MNIMIKNILLFVFSTLLGNCAGDKQIELDCHKNGTTTLLYGVSIKCEILK